MLTISTKKEEFATGKRIKNWWVVDATGIPVGRISSRIAAILRGKHQSFFTPHVDCGDYVIVINAKKTILTGNKLTQKKYYRYSGYIGGLKEEKADYLLANNPEKLILHAVKKMMPKNILGRKSFNKLFVYPDSTHPHQANLPQELKFEKTTKYQYKKSKEIGEDNNKNEEIK